MNSNPKTTKAPIRQRRSASNAATAQQSSSRLLDSNDDMDESVFQDLPRGHLSRRGYELDGFVVESVDHTQRESNMLMVPASSIPDPDFGPIRDGNGSMRRIMDKPRVNKFHSINAPMAESFSEDNQDPCYDELRKTRNDVS